MKNTGRIDLGRGNHVNVLACNNIKKKKMHEHTAIAQY
jgi:hypothetical protein